MKRWRRHRHDAAASHAQRLRQISVLAQGALLGRQACARPRQIVPRIIHGLTMLEADGMAGACFATGASSRAAATISAHALSQILLVVHLSLGPCLSSGRPAISKVAASISATHLDRGLSTDNAHFDCQPNPSGRRQRYGLQVRARSPNAARSTRAAGPVASDRQYARSTV